MDLVSVRLRSRVHITFQQILSQIGAMMSFPNASVSKGVRRRVDEKTLHWSVASAWEVPLPVLQYLRGFPHAKAQLAGCEATVQLRCPALSGPSLRRKRHESVMGCVMCHGPTRRPTHKPERAQSGKCKLEEGKRQQMEF